MFFPLLAITPEMILSNVNFPLAIDRMRREAGRIEKRRWRVGCGLEHFARVHTRVRGCVGLGFGGDTLTKVTHAAHRLFGK